MARTAAAGTWHWTSVEADCFQRLRHLLEFKNGFVASAIGMDEATFSQAHRGQNGRGFRPDHRQKLSELLEKEVARFVVKARAGTGDSTAAGEAEELLARLFSIGDGARVLRNVRPGGALPIDARNYVDRAADLSIPRIVQGSANSVAIVGGPRTGKSSFMLRLAEQAERAGRRVRPVAMTEMWALAAREAGGRLSLRDLMNQTLLAITNDPRPLVKLDGPDHFLVHLMQQRLVDVMRGSELAGTMVLLEGFNDARNYGAEPEDLAIIMGQLFGHNLRRDNCTIVLPVDGVTTTFDLVSEPLSRAEKVNVASATIYDVQKLGAAVLGEGLPLDVSTISLLMDAFGGVLFLHHAALDMIANRRDAGETITPTSLHSDVEIAKNAVMEQLISPGSPSTKFDQTSRELAKYTREVEEVLRVLDRIGDPQGSAEMQLTRALAEGSVQRVLSNYQVSRGLVGSGLLPEGAPVPEFTRVIAKRRVSAR